jgi:hypothetical protein
MVPLNIRPIGEVRPSSDKEVVHDGRTDLRWAGVGFIPAGFGSCFKAHPRLKHFQSYCRGLLSDLARNQAAKRARLPTPWKNA